MKRRGPNPEEGKKQADSMGEGPGGDSLALNVSTAVLTYVAAAMIFRFGWRESEARVWRFNSFADVNKADWSAR